MRCLFRPSGSIFDGMSMLPVYFHFCIDWNHILSEEISLIDAIVINTTTSPIFSSFIGRYPCYERVLLFVVHSFHLPSIPLGSVTNWTLQQIVKEKNAIYADMQLLKMRTNPNKKEKKSTAKTTTAIPMSTNKNAQETIQKSKIHAGWTRRRRRWWIGERWGSDQKKGNQSTETERIRRTDVEKVMAHSSEKRATRKPVGVKGKSSAGSSDGCTTVDEEQEETRLIEQSKRDVEGPGLPHSLISSFPISMKVFDRVPRRSTNTRRKSVKNCRIFTMTIKQRRRRQHYHRLFSLPLSRSTEHSSRHFSSPHHRSFDAATIL